MMMEHMPYNLLKCNDLTIKYNKKILFKNFTNSFSIGKIYLFYGPSGCGKTSLIKSLGGLINVKNVNKVKCSFSFFSCTLLDNLTVKENFLLHSFDIDYNYFYKNNFKYLLDKKVKLLSSGEKNLITVILTLSSDSNFIFLDEPLSHLDSDNIIVIQNLLKEKRNTKCIIITDHEKDKYLNFIDEYFYINNFIWIKNISSNNNQKIKDITIKHNNKINCIMFFKFIISNYKRNLLAPFFNALYTSFFITFVSSFIAFIQIKDPFNLLENAKLQNLINLTIIILLFLGQLVLFIISFSKDKNERKKFFQCLACQQKNILTHLYILFEFSFFLIVLILTTYVIFLPTLNLQKNIYFYGQNINYNFDLSFFYIFIILSISIFAVLKVIYEYYLYRYLGRIIND